jgi:hypothetical protein
MSLQFRYYFKFAERSSFAQTIRSKLATATDTWTTRQMVYSFAGTLGYWINANWELIERLIDFHPLRDKEHAGAWAAKGFAKAASDLGFIE